MNQIFETVGYLHIKDRKILLAKSKKYDVFFVPGGKKDSEEDNGKAISREVKEELSVDLVSDSIRYFGEFKAQAYAKEKGIKV